MCCAPNTAVAFGSTSNSRVAICKSPAGQLGYHGVRISDGAKLLASATADADGSYVAKQDGVTYTVTSSALVVSDANGVIRREPMELLTARPRRQRRHEALAPADPKARKKHEYAPVWQAPSPSWSTTKSNVSPSQS